MFSCGQYLYLNIPSISPYEWHPFTISSAPSDGNVTCHIKKAPAGDHTFTGQLLEIAKSNILAQDLQVNVDGPYGEFLDHTHFDDILLLGGGIGVTPVHSIFRELSSEIRRGVCACKRVHMVWVVRNRVELAPFFDTLVEANEDDQNGRLELSVYVDMDESCPKGVETFHDGVMLTGGRPDVAGLVKELATQKALKERATEPHVFVCGPPGLAAAADLACLKNGVSFHKEVFAF